MLPSRARNLRLRGNMPDYYDVRVVGHALSAGGFVDVQPVVFAAVPIGEWLGKQHTLHPLTRVLLQSSSATRRPAFCST